MNGVYEEAGGVATSYYTFGGQRVAMRTGGTVYWLHGDHLGSASLTTNASGQKVAELRYLPFGETRWAWGTTPTDRRYTGQREVPAIGLYDYNARMYWPAACPERSRRAGRFVSADTVVPGPGNPQNLNRYAYTLNNPLRYNDPTGHDVGCPGQDAGRCADLEHRQQLAEYEYWRWLYENSDWESYNGALRNYYMVQYAYAVAVLQDARPEQLTLMQAQVAAAQEQLVYAGYYGQAAANAAQWSAGMGDLLQQVPGVIGAGAAIVKGAGGRMVQLVGEHSARNYGKVFVGSDGRLYPGDWQTTETKQMRKEGFSSEVEARTYAFRQLRQGYVDLGDGKWRSQDGQLQVRIEPGVSHVNLEKLNPQTGEVLGNTHLIWRK